MPYSTAARNAMLNALNIVYASLHSGDPGDSGANELSTVGGVYARQAITVGTASNGQRAAQNQPVFNVPAGSTVSYIGYWTASSGGTYLGGHNVNDETYTNQGTYTITSATFSAS